MGQFKKNKQQKSAEQEFKTEHEFEKDPARCGNCKNRVVRRFFVKGTGMVSGKPTCSKAGFHIKDYSICNAWVGFHGESLE